MITSGGGVITQLVFLGATSRDSSVIGGSGDSTTGCPGSLDVRHSTTRTDDRVNVTFMSTIDDIPSLDETRYAGYRRVTFRRLGRLDIFFKEKFSALDSDNFAMFVKDDANEATIAYMELTYTSCDIRLHRVTVAREHRRKGYATTIIKALQRVAHESSRQLRIEAVMSMNLLKILLAQGCVQAEKDINAPFVWSLCRDAESGVEDIYFKDLPPRFRALWFRALQMQTEQTHRYLLHQQEHQMAGRC